MPDYAELHCHSYFSLLDGASSPEDLVRRAMELGLPALALTDQNGLYGALAFHKAAVKAGVKPLIGAEITLEADSHLTLLARDMKGYANLCRVITQAHLHHDRENPCIDWPTLAQHAEGLICLSGCRRAKIPALLVARNREKAQAVARRCLEVFGQDGFYIELQNHLVKGDSDLNHELVALARDVGARYVATGNVHYARPESYRLHDVLNCIQHGTTLDRSSGLLRSNHEFHMKSSTEMLALFAEYPEALDNTLRIADECNVALDFSAYRFPEFTLPQGENAESYLARLCLEKAKERYPELTDRVRNQIHYELKLIARLGLSGYFLIVWDIMDYARRNGIPAQGRGSAANSVVAYILGITRVDPISNKLFVGRFLNEEMSSIPDIDIDVSTNHREKLIQYVYRKYGQEHTAMVCTYVTFQARNAIREVGKVLGMPADLLDRMAKTVGHYSARDIDEDLGSLEKFKPYINSKAWEHFLSLCREIADFPRHLSIHVGGMLISSCPLTDVVPLEKAAMPGRVVCQWDKDGVEDAGLVKVDILGLRMLSLIDDVVKLVKEKDTGFDLGKIPHDDSAVYDMIGRADTLGVFQVESRAQMQTLPRTKPRSIEDLTVEVAIIRPGPLQGNMVHPYIRRRQGKEKVTYPHPKLKGILEETKGVILFQEQVLRCAIAIAGFSPGEADSLRRAMSRKRSRQAMEELKERFLEGARKNSIEQSVAERVFDTLKGFAEYGFCKSHAAGFALLAYESAWLKHYHPAESYTALLNNQPMGFYSPEVIVGDARRHGISALPVDINLSRGNCAVEDGKIRLGFRYVRAMGEKAIVQLGKARREGPFVSLRDFYRRSGLSSKAIRSLIMAGAADSFKRDRRALLWELGILEKNGDDPLPLEYPEYQVPLPGMTDWEKVAAEYGVQGLSAHIHPMQLLRDGLAGDGIIGSDRVFDMPDGKHIRTAGYVICRQMPVTAKGHVFLTIEDEHGLMNIVLKPPIYQKYRYTVRTEPLLVVEGILQRREEIVNIVAEHLESLKPNWESTGPVPRARNFC